MAENEIFNDDELQEPSGDGLIIEEGADSASEEDEQGMFEHFRLNVDKGQTPLRVDKYMACHLMDTSRHRVQLAIKNGYVRVNDKLAKANLIVRPGDVIRFVMPYERRGFEVLPQDIPLDIVYEDDDLLVVNKPAGMVVHPGHGHFEGTLINALSYHLGISQGPDARMSVWVCWFIVSTWILPVFLSSRRMMSRSLTSPGSFSGIPLSVSMLRLSGAI